MVSTIALRTDLEFPDFLVAPTRNEIGNECHVLCEFHCVVTESAILVSEGLTFTIWVPVIMCLIMAMVLIEGVVKISIDP